MKADAIRVIKVGGSLFDLPGLGQRLRAWRSKQPPCRDVLVAGCGQLANTVRTLEETHRWSAEASHWLCIRLMSITAAMLEQLVPGSRRCLTLNDVVEADGNAVCVFDCAEFCSPHAQTLGSALPRDWSVTSDSVAAALAIALRAPELVLLKSTLPDETPRLPSGDADLVVLGAAGYVDRYLADAAAGVPGIRCVDLRRDGWPAVTLREPRHLD